jgi:hypothetical protein
LDLGAYDLSAATHDVTVTNDDDDDDKNNNNNNNNA